MLSGIQCISRPFERRCLIYIIIFLHRPPRTWTPRMRARRSRSWTRWRGPTSQSRRSETPRGSSGDRQFWETIVRVLGVWIRKRRTDVLCVKRILAWNIVVRRSMKSYSVLFSSLKITLLRINMLVDNSTSWGIINYRIHNIKIKLDYINLGEDDNSWFDLFNLVVTLNSRTKKNGLSG